MSFVQLFRKTPSFFAISYLSQDDLRVIFIERKGDQYKMIGHETFLKQLNENTKGEAAAARSRLNVFQTKSPAWIHLILRNFAFVKTFSISVPPNGDLNAVLADRLHTETPYLSEEVILHHKVQKIKGNELYMVLLLGVSKAVLSEHAHRLESLGIIPNRSMLSTDILRWFYEQQFSPSLVSAGSTVMIHWFANQIELLFFKDGVLMQSHWFSQDSAEHLTLKESIQASLTVFQREWREKPEKIFFSGEVPNDAKALISNLSLQAEKIDMDETLKGLPLLLATALKLYSSAEVSHFDLPLEKVTRSDESKTQKRSRLRKSIAWFSVFVLLLSFVQLAIILIPMTWFSIQAKQVSASIQELKGIRRQALEVETFYKKKSMPFNLLITLRNSIPESLFLRDLRYEEAGNKMVIKGIAPDQAQIDQFISLLSKDPFFSHIAIQGVQAERVGNGEPTYQFIIEGVLN